MADKKFDIVLWGATGFTGRLVAEYFSVHVASAFPELKWAVAGRNQKKLLGVQSDCATSAKRSGRPLREGVPAVLVGDATSQQSVDAVVRQTRVIISTAGPFAKYGTPVLDACVRFGTDYADINGEPLWHREMIEKYDARARAAGVKLVLSCGFDSIPFDLGALHAAQQLRDKFGSDAKRITAFVNMRGQFSGGTLASGINGDESGRAADLKDPFLLLQGKACRQDGQHYEKRAKVVYDDLVRSWTAPSGMAFINRKIVRRSAGLFAHAALHKGFSRDGFAFEEVTLARDEKHAKKIAFALSVDVKTRKALVKSGRLPKPGQGPSKEVRDKSWFKVHIVAESADGDRVCSRVSGGDPGYDETAKMLGESGLLLLELQGGQAPGGMLTPAFAFQEQIINRLHLKGIRFENVDVKSLGNPSKL